MNWDYIAGFFDGGGRNTMTFAICWSKKGRYLFPRCGISWHICIGKSLFGEREIRTSFLQSGKRYTFWIEGFRKVIGISFLSKNLKKSWSGNLTNYLNPIRKQRSIPYYAGHFE